MGVDLEPVPIGRRWRALDPVVVGVVALVVLLVVAVVKPWESAAPADLWEVLDPVVGDHPTWGVVTVVGDGPSFRTDREGHGIGAVWAAGTPAAADPPVIDLAPGGRRAFFLGLTWPPGDAPSDVRVWLLRRGGELDWIETAALPPRPADGLRLLARSGTSGAVPWEVGEYRIDLLRSGRVERLRLRLTDPAGTVPEPVRRPVTERRLVAPLDSDPSGVHIGMFATVDGKGVPLDVGPDRPLDEADAWLASVAPPAEGAAPVVATAVLPRATGLGVMLTAHASVQLAVLRRLAPGPLVPAPPARGGISNIEGRTPYVVFRAPDGGAIPPGVYAIAVSWTDGTGLHAETWHVQLRPSPAPAAR